MKKLDSPDLHLSVAAVAGRFSLNTTTLARAYPKLGSQVRFISKQAYNGRNYMFEFEEDIVDNLLHEDKDFLRLYQKHDMLNRRVDDAYHGVEEIDEFSLEALKKEKLFLKDKMAALIDDYRQRRA